MRCAPPLFGDDKPKRATQKTGAMPDPDLRALHCTQLAGLIFARSNPLQRNKHAYRCTCITEAGITRFAPLPLTRPCDHLGGHHLLHTSTQRVQRAQNLHAAFSWRSKTSHHPSRHYYTSNTAHCEHHDEKSAHAKHVPLPQRLTEARMAWLSASEPLATNTTSSGEQPRSAATRARALTTAALHARPRAWVLEGLPKHSPMKGNISRETWAVEFVDPTKYVVYFSNIEPRQLLS